MVEGQVEVLGAGGQEEVTRSRDHCKSSSCVGLGTLISGL